jgi:hypothetical protein
MLYTIALSSICYTFYLIFFTRYSDMILHSICFVSVALSNSGLGTGCMDETPTDAATYSNLTWVPTKLDLEVEND